MAKKNSRPSHDVKNHPIYNIPDTPMGPGPTDASALAAAAASPEAPNPAQPAGLPLPPGANQ